MGRRFGKKQRVLYSVLPNERRGSSRKVQNLRNSSLSADNSLDQLRELQSGRASLGAPVKRIRNYTLFSVIIYDSFK